MIKSTLRIFLFIALIAQPPSVFPADHVDGPAARADPAADLADVYAWMTADTEQVNLALTIPAALFSDAVHYVFEVESSEALGESGVLTRVICSFDDAQTVQCWVEEDDYVGIASEEWVSPVVPGGFVYSLACETIRFLQQYWFQCCSNPDSRHYG